MLPSFRAPIFAAGVALLTAAVVQAPAAQADTHNFRYLGTAGGTQVTAVGLTVKSDQTAQSVLSGAGDGHDNAKIASVYVQGLVSVGAVTTDETATAEGDGAKLVSHAKTLGVSLLGGAIKVDAIETTSTVEASSTIAPHGDTSTKFLGLTIGGKKYPINVKENTGVVIPGVASVVINASTSGANDTSAGSMGAGLIVTLLKARGGAAAGAEIDINPTYAAIEQFTSPETGAVLGGTAYGSYVEAHVGDKVQVESGRSAQVGMPGMGTNGDTFTNATAAVNLPGVLNLGAIESSENGVTNHALSEVTESTKIARLSLFNGLISATALGSTSHAKLVGGDGSQEGSLQFVNLRIAGKAIPIDVGPNTTIHVANLGTVTINEQKSVAVKGVAHGVQVIGLHIVLDTARAGLPVGAEVQVATSQAVVYG
jgi:hypothetical protein